MLRTTRTSGDASTGFTLLEILVVIGIIAALVAITVTVFGNIMDNANRAATMVTISKVDKLLQQQISAWSRQFRDSTEVRQSAPRFSGIVSNPRGQEALALKDFYRLHFPQTAAEAGQAFSDWVRANTESEADSSELLYLALTQGKVLGAAPVDADSFTGNELADTDGDDFAELVDAWGNPLRFYRWPTRLLFPFGTVGSVINTSANSNSSGPPITADATSIPLADVSGLRQIFDGIRKKENNGNPTATVYVSIGREIIEVHGFGGDSLDPVRRGAQSTNPEIHPDGAVVKLAPFPDMVTLVFGSLNSAAVIHDPDDPRGDILQGSLVSSTVFEDSFHTLDSFHAPLIVSAGSDGLLGLLDPSIDGTGDWDRGNLAQPEMPFIGSGPNRDLSVIAWPGNSTLNDNLTNQMQGLGN